VIRMAAMMVFMFILNPWLIDCPVFF